VVGAALHGMVELADREQARTDHGEEPSSKRIDDTVNCHARIAAVIEKDTTNRAIQRPLLRRSIAITPLRPHGSGEKPMTIVEPKGNPSDHLTV
jgi:hypothetical protein